MSLNELRKEIDQIDSELIGLLSKRMLIAVRAGRKKEQIEDAARENEILDRLMKRHDPLISPAFSGRLYHEIMTESKSLQRKNLKLAGFQGERGAYGELACKKFDKSFIPVPCVELLDVFEGVANGDLDFGVVPIENSSEGAITAVGHLVTEKDVTIVGEVILPVRHSLLALPDVTLREVKTVYSHPQALAQCRNFIARNNLISKPFYDTAGAAAMIASEKPTAAAAIAGRICSDLYGLKVLKKNIEDSESNFTRFLILSKNKFQGKCDKCTITFSTEDKVGALTSVLGIFSDANINLTMIESIPSRDSTGRSKFLIDFLGSVQERRTNKALEKIRTKTIGFKLLGCYRSWYK